MSTDSFLNVTIGAGLVGFAVALFLYGVTSGQVIAYFVRYGRGWSSFWAKCYVILLWLTDTLHIVTVSCTMFDYVVLGHGKPENIARLIWAFALMIIATECSNVIVRLGYAYKIWRFSDRKALVPGIVAVVTTLLFINGLVFGVLDFRIKSFDAVQKLQSAFYVAFAFQISVDVMIAGAMLAICTRFYTGIRTFDTVIQLIIVFTVNTGVLSVILTTIGMVFFVSRPGTLLYLSMYWALTKLHTCSFLAVLNAEKDLVERASRHARCDAPVLTTAVRMGTGLFPSQTVGSIQLMDFSTPSSRGDTSTSQLVGEEPLQSRDSREPSVGYAL